MDKDKKTLTISSDLKKKMIATSIKTSGKKSFCRKNYLGRTNHLINPRHPQALLINLTIKRKVLLENL